MVVEPSNINYLLGAMVQSGAALVAIVGGLLGARYVSLHTEKASARRDLAAARAAEVETREQADAAEYDLMDNRARQFLCRESVWLTVLDPSLSADHLVEEAKAEAERNYQESAAERVISFTRNRVPTVMERLLKDASEVPKSGTWAHFRRARGVTVAGPDVEFIYETVLYKARYDAEVKPTSPAATNALTDFRRAVAAEYERLKSREAVLVQIQNDGDRRLLQAADEADAAERHLNALKEGEGFSLAIEVLGVIAATTIVLPLVFMIPDVPDFTAASRWAFVAAFVGGLVMLGWYLWVYARFIAEKRDTMPEHVWGLFTRGRKSKTTD